MSIKLEDFLIEVNKYVDDNISGTTTANGNAAKTSLVDSALSKYPDGYFGGPERDPEWWAYVGTTLRSVENFVGSSGTVIVHNAFGAQVTITTAYSLHKYDWDKKVEASNDALYDAYPWFYKRVEDETTLDGTGSSDNKYTIPVTFTNFPDHIYKKHTSRSIITYTEIIDYDRTELNGTRYFYANITTGDDISLVGRTYLSPFTTDTSTTELTDGQARIVALKAAANLYHRMANTVDATDAGRFEVLANRFEALWDRDKVIHMMPVEIRRELDFSWLD